MFRRVALLTFHACVLAFQRVPGLLVIESFGVPLDKREVESVMVGMALHALLARSRPHPVRKVQSLVSVEPRRNFTVALQAFENHFSAQLVASGTARGALEVFMCAREWARRNLSHRRSR